MNIDKSNRICDQLPRGDVAGPGGRGMELRNLLKVGLAVAALAATAPLGARGVTVGAPAAGRRDPPPSATEMPARPLRTTAGPKQYIYFYYIKGPGAPASDPACSPTVGHDGRTLGVYLIETNLQGPPDEKFAYDQAAKADSCKLVRMAYAMEDLPLEKRGYLLFVWNEPNRSLTDVFFIYHGNTSQINHSFYNPKSLNRQGDMSAFYRQNVKKGADGNPLSNRQEKFYVFFQTVPPLEDTEHELMKMDMVVHNENTTNVGP